MPLCKLTSKCRIFFLFLPSVSETADGGITQLIERNIGEERTLRQLGCVVPRLIERNTTIPKDEASKLIDTKDGLENYCDQLVDDCGDVPLVDAQGHRFGGTVRQG